MPLEVTNQTSKSTKIKEYLDTIFTIFDQDISLSDDDAEKIIQKIQHYDLSPILAFNSDNKIVNRRYDQFIFCDLLLPTTTKGIDTASRTFTFLKSQAVSALEILRPLIKSKQATYVLSELDSINYDIHNTQSSINDAITLDYLAYLAFQFHGMNQNDTAESNQKSDLTDKHPLLQIYQAINTSSLINEIANPGDFHQNFNNMPLLIPSLKKTFPHISQDTLMPFISYLQLVANNQNHLYL